MASFAFDCSTFAFDYATQRQKTQRQKGRTFSLPPLLLAMLAKAKGKGKSRPTPAGWPDTACLLMRWATFAFAFCLCVAFCLSFCLCLLPSGHYALLLPLRLLPLCLGRTFFFPAKV